MPSLFGPTPSFVMIEFMPWVRVRRRVRGRGRGRGEGWGVGVLEGLRLEG